MLKKTEHPPTDTISFKDYIQTMGGSGILYEAECRSILRKWKAADWIRVDDYIAPMVAEILVDAAETNRPLYDKIMICVMEAYKELQHNLALSPERPDLTRIK